MALQHGARCTACNLDIRPEIDRRLLVGESTRHVSAWLSTQGITLSHKALALHKNQHCPGVDDIQRLIAERDAKRREAKRFEEKDQRHQEQLSRIDQETQKVHNDAIDRVIANVDLLDEVASINLYIMRGLAEYMGMKGNDLPDVQLFNGASMAVIKCVAERREFMVAGDKPGADEPRKFVVELVAPTKPVSEPEADDDDDGES